MFVLVLLRRIMTLLGLLFQSGTHDVNLVGRAMHSVEKIFIHIEDGYEPKTPGDCYVHCVHEEETWVVNASS